MNILPDWISSRLDDNFLRLIDKYRVSNEYIFEFIIIASVLIIGWYLAIKKIQVWKSASFLILSILTLRLLLLWNPISWTLYHEVLAPDDVGWRQDSVIIYETKKYFETPPHVKYLAIGSSQAYAVFNSYARSHEDLSLFTLPAMGTLDYMLYKKYIAALGPEYLLLYLSEFDIARIPPFNAYKHAPAQMSYWPELYARIKSLSHWDESGTFISDMLIGEVFPEYKYSFVFRSIVNKMLGHPEDPQKGDIRNDARNDAFNTQLQNLAENMKEEGIDFNVTFLRDFLTFCEEQGMKVVIIEGQYNPLAYNQKNRQINSIVDRKLQEVANNYRNTIFLRRKDVYNFTDAQYRDIYHVYPEAGLLFTENLLHSLEPLIERASAHTPI